MCNHYARARPLCQGVRNLLPTGRSVLRMLCPVLRMVGPRPMAGPDQWYATNPNHGFTGLKKLLRQENADISVLGNDPAKHTPCLSNPQAGRHSTISSFQGHQNVVLRPRRPPSFMGRQKHSLTCVFSVWFTKSPRDSCCAISLTLVYSIHTLHNAKYPSLHYRT